MNEVNAKIVRLKNAFSVKTNAELAEKLGLSPHSISNWQRRKLIPEKILLKCSQITDISTNWLNTGRGDMKKQITTHIDTDINYEEDTYLVSKISLEASAGDGIENFTVTHTGNVLLDKGLFRHPVEEKNLIIIKVKGDSMEPTILDESHIIIDQSQTENIDSIYAINLDGNIMVKRLQFNLDGNIEIISDNIKYQKKIYNPKESQIHFEILGKKILSIQ